MKPNSLSLNLFGFALTPGSLKANLRLNHLFVRGDEPVIWQQMDDSGNPRWYVYNPATRTEANLGSETEVQHWLAQQA